MTKLQFGFDFSLMKTCQALALLTGELHAGIRCILAMVEALQLANMCSTECSTDRARTAFLSAIVEAGQGLLVGQQWAAVPALLDVLLLAGIDECPKELA